MPFICLEFFAGKQEDITAVTKFDACPLYAIAYMETKDAVTFIDQKVPEDIKNTLKIYFYGIRTFLILLQLTTMAHNSWDSNAALVPRLAAEISPPIRAVEELKTQFCTCMTEVNKFATKEHNAEFAFIVCNRLNLLEKGFFYHEGKDYAKAFIKAGSALLESVQKHPLAAFILNFEDV